MGYCCTMCSDGKSKCEVEIFNILKSNGIDFSTEKTFEDCRYKYKLRFDFFIEESRTLIEYNGIQHYEAIEYFGGLDSYKEVIIRDSIKAKWCLDNGYNLVVIKYTDDILSKICKLIKF